MRENTNFGDGDERLFNLIFLFIENLTKCFHVQRILISVKTNFQLVVTKTKLHRSIKLHTHHKV